MATINAAGMPNPITVGFGGTGNNNLLTNSILIGHGTGSILNSGIGTNGQLLIGSTGAAPLFASVFSSDGSVTFTTGANSLELSTNGSSGSVSWTPALYFSTTGVVPLSTATGYYIKIGKLVIYNFNLQSTLGAASGASGNAYVTGLPGSYDTTISSYYHGSQFSIYYAYPANTVPMCYSRLDTSTGYINLCFNQANSNNPTATAAIMGGSSPGSVYITVNGYGFYFTT